MFRLAAQRIVCSSLKTQIHHNLMVNNVIGKELVNNNRLAFPALSRLYSSEVVETDEEFDARYVAFFSRPDIDGWELRKGMHDIFGMDLVPEPKIINAALRACRRLNDYSLTTRFLEAIMWKCKTNKDLWPYVLREIKPTLDELGISTPEELGYGQPEMALKSVFDVHG